MENEIIIRELNYLCRTYDGLNKLIVSTKNRLQALNPDADPKTNPIISGESLQKNGQIIKTGHIHAFSESILQIINDKDLRIKMANESRKIILSKASTDAAVSGFLTAIQNVF